MARSVKYWSPARNFDRQASPSLLNGLSPPRTPNVQVQNGRTAERLGRSKARPRSRPARYWIGGDRLTKTFKQRLGLRQLQRIRIEAVGDQGAAEEGDCNFRIQRLREIAKLEASL